MATHTFTKKAIKGLNQAWEYAVFALNIPMTDSDREELKKLLKKAFEILNKY